MHSHEHAPVSKTLLKTLLDSINSKYVSALQLRLYLRQRPLPHRKVSYRNIFPIDLWDRKADRLYVPYLIVSKDILFVLSKSVVKMRRLEMTMSWFFGTRYKDRVTVLGSHSFKSSAVVYCDVDVFSFKVLYCTVLYPFIGIVAVLRCSWIDFLPNVRSLSLTAGKSFANLATVSRWRKSMGKGLLLYEMQSNKCGPLSTKSTEARFSCDRRSQGRY